MRTLVPGSVGIACAAALLVAAPAASARTLAGAGRVLAAGRTVTLTPETRPTRAVRLTVRPDGCGKAGRLAAAAGGTRGTFGLRGVRPRTLVWPVELPEG